MFILRVRTGNQTGKTFKIADSLKIGRGSNCQIQIDDGKASRSHSLIFLKEGRVYIRDLESKNGTFVGGERIEEKEMRPGAVITIGDTEVALEDVIDESELIGQRLGGYRVLELVGKGGMGVVFKANQLSLDRIVALKVLNKSLVSRKDLVERFLKEARAAGILNHPNLIRVHDVGKEGETYFFSMEFVDGPTVSSILRKTKNFPERIAVYVIKEVAKALEYAHGRDLVHRDIKPSNVMVDNEGNVKLADLGIAETLQNIEAQEGKSHLMGTPEYMSPEQAKAQPAGTESDIYSLGATLYHMVTGRPPFKGSKASEIIKKVRSESKPPPLADIAPEASSNLIQLVENMMEKEPENRIRSASEVIRIIQEKWHWHLDQDAARRQRLLDLISGVKKKEKEQPKSEPKISFHSLPFKHLIAGVAVLIIVVVSLLALRKPKIEPAPPTPPQDNVREQYLKNAGESYQNLREYGQKHPEDLEDIARLCREFLAKYSESPYASKVRSAAKKTKQKIEQRRYLARSQSAYDKIEKYTIANPDNLNEQWRKWRDFRTDHQESPLVEEASVKIKRIRNAMEDRAMEKFGAMLTQADVLAAKGKYHAAAKILKQYENNHHSIKIKTEAVTRIKSYQIKEKDRFRGIKKDFDQALHDKRYGEALRICNEFIAEVEEGPKVGEAKTLIGTAQKNAVAEYESVAAKIHAYLEIFDFVNAESLAMGLEEKLGGILDEKKYAALASKTAALRQLHSTVVEKIETTRKHKLLPFTIGTVGRGKAAGATMERLMVRFGELQQDLLWSKFTKDEVFQVYRTFMDERFKETQKLLSQFAQEYKIEGKYYQP